MLNRQGAQRLNMVKKCVDSMEMERGAQVYPCAKRANHMTNPNHRTVLVGLGCEFQQLIIIFAQSPAAPPYPYYLR
jgi:altronate dehydratase